MEDATREADEAQREAEQRSQALEERLTRETESSILRAEVEKLRALEELREEHRRAMERERKLMDDWMQDVKERFRVEKQHLEERISEWRRQDRALHLPRVVPRMRIGVQAALTTRTRPATSTSSK